MNHGVSAQSPGLPARRLPRSLAPVVSALEFNPPTGAISLAELADRAGVDRVSARHLASKLVREGWLHRVKRGYYEFVPAAALYPSGSTWPLLATIRQPHLISGLTAAREHGLTPQLATRHLVVVDDDHPVPRPLYRSETFRVARLRPWRVFGSEPVNRDGVDVPFARIDRVIIDAIQYPDWFSGIGEAARVISRGLPRADRGALIDDAARWRSTSLFRRLGWWGDRVLEGGWSDRERVLLQRDQKHGVYVSLVPGGARRGLRDREWGVTLNVPEEALLMETAVR
jgi:predicted transcriptional regulator of viral defense system